MGRDAENHLGKIIKEQRISLSLTLQQLAVRAGISASHIGRIERGERFPSAPVLRRLAKPLSLREDELFTLAGYLSPPSGPVGAGEAMTASVPGRLDPIVARTLAQEPVEVQRAVIGILTILKTLSAARKAR